MNKELNMSKIIIPQGIALNEHFCRRWMSIKSIKQLEINNYNKIVVLAQYSNFLADKSDFFCITLSCPATLSNQNMSLTLGFNITDNLKNNIKFINDDNIVKDFINETCERCSLSDKECDLRVSPPIIYNKEKQNMERNLALEELINGFK